MKICDICGKEVEDNQWICPYCGCYADQGKPNQLAASKPEEPNTVVENGAVYYQPNEEAEAENDVTIVSHPRLVRCPHCGKMQDASTKNCLYCSKPIDERPTEETQPQTEQSSFLTTQKPKPNKTVGIGGIIFIIIIIVLISVVLIVGTNSNNNTEKSTTTSSSITTTKETTTTTTTKSSSSSTTKKYSSSSSKSKIEADTWYTVTGYSGLLIKNGEVMKNGVIVMNTMYGVSYFPVCKYCKTMGMVDYEGVEYGKIKMQSYTCAECGKQTTVYLRFSSYA